MSAAYRLLAVVLLALALVAGGYRWGERATTNEYLAAQAKKDHVAQERFAAEVLRGDVASTQLQADLGQQATNFQQLDKAFDDYRQRFPILARPVGGGAVAAPGAAAVPGATGAVAAVAGDVPDPGLSAGAVWMWNSALAGRDTPAGACGLADPASAACAAGTGIALADAWANHTTNAQLCAADRTRHQALIDFIQGLKETPRAD